MHGIMVRGDSRLLFLLGVVMPHNLLVAALLVYFMSFVVRRICNVQSCHLVRHFSDFSSGLRRGSDPDSVSEPQNRKPIRLSLVIERASGRVMFAECDKSFADVLLSFLVLPLGKFIKLANKESGIDAMDELYKSVEALGVGIFSTEASRNMLLQPRSAYGSKCSQLAVKIDRTDYTQYYHCPKTPCLFGSTGFVSFCENSICNCGSAMSKKFQHVDERAGSSAGFLAGFERFIVTDDLQVMPARTREACSLLLRAGISDSNGVVRKDVNIGFEEVVQLLRLSAISKTPLTHCFQPNAAPTCLDPVLAPRHFLAANPVVSDAMRVKLMFVKSTKEAIYLEAREDFVDLLFSFLTLPLGSISKLSHADSLLGSIDNLYRSVTLLHANGFLSRRSAEMLQNPKLERMFGCRNQLLGVEEDERLVLEVGPKQPSLHIVNPKGPEDLCHRGGGFVKQQTYFLVTDSLSVETFSPASGIGRLGIPYADLGQLTVTIGREEGLALLKAALTSKTVLNDVFGPLIKPKRR